MYAIMRSPESHSLDNRRSLTRVRNIALTTAGLAIAVVFEVGSMEETAPAMEYALAATAITSGSIASLCQLALGRTLTRNDS